MNKTELSKTEMIELLELINEQAQMIKSHQGEIPQLYIDMLKKNVLRLYEHIHTLDQIKHLEDNISKLGNKSLATEQKEIKEKESSFNAGSPKKTEIEPEQKDSIVEPEHLPGKIIPEKHTEKEQPVIEFKIKQQDEAAMPRKNPILAGSDLFGEAAPSIADKLSEQKDPSLGDKMQQHQITDIKAAIGINDKFLFVNELFSGNLQAYNQAVEQLNKANNHADATIIFESLHIKNKWENKNEAVRKLKTIVNRKTFIN